MTHERVWSRRIADELWSGVVTPLSFTMLAGPMAEHMVRRRLENAGLTTLAAEPVFRLSHGHVYVNASLIAEVMAEIPSVFLSDGLLDLLPGSLRGELRAQARSVLSPSLATILVRLGVHERAWMPWARADVFADAASRIAADLALLAPPPDASGATLVATIDRVRERLGEFLEIVSWGMIHAYVFFHLTAELIARWAPDVDAHATMSELTMGLGGIRTFEVHDELLRCTGIASADGTLRCALQSDPAAVAASAVAGGQGDFGAGLRAVLERHGHRFVGRDLSQPTWREQPVVVVEMIRKLLDSGARESAAERVVRRRAAVGRVGDRIAAGLGGTVKRLVFDRVLAWCERYYVLRENMRYHADLFMAALRSLALVAGRRLVADRALARTDDVFYLEAGELCGYLRGTGEAADTLRERAAARRVAGAAFCIADPPECLFGDDEPAADAIAGRAQAVAGDATVARGLPLAGLGVSPGRATGCARVVRSLDDLQELEAGEVVVATATEPSWTSLLAVAGAIVLEMGGPLSHGAIVARELGIPAVVNVANATRFLATGDRIAIDGRSGAITAA